MASAALDSGTETGPIGGDHADEAVDDVPAFGEKRSMQQDVNGSKRPKLCPAMKDSESHGIREYVSKEHDGFFGILKHRISDFIVNEIDSERRVVKLTNTTLDAAESMSAPEVDAADETGDGAFDKLIQAVGDEAVGKMKRMIQVHGKRKVPVNEEDAGKEEDSVKEEVPREVIVPAPEGRDARAALHTLIRTAFPSLESQTDDIPEGDVFVKVFRVKLLADCLMAKNRSKSRGFLHPGKRLSKWPPNRPQFCHFVLYKENQDTMDAISVVSGNLGQKTGNFVFSGTKDKRGITSQRVSVQKLDAARLLGLNAKLRRIKVGNCEYKKTSLRLGDNWGNQFRIVLRGMKPEQRDTASVALKELGEKGFINYYGMQRFGSTEISTHTIGVALLRRDWRLAVDLILRPRPNDRPEMRECRRVWNETRDPQKAVDLLHRRKCPERCLLSGLIKHAHLNDFCGALNWIPRPTRLMYVHAYQSLIWNSTVSSKLAKHGLEPRVGDLVAQRDDLKRIETKDVKVLTAEDVGNYDIYDVVLPLVGHDVIFPQNESKDWMEEIFTEDGLTLESFNGSVRDYALPGGYRHILVKPKDLSWNLVEYSDEDEPLNTVDEEELIKSSFMNKTEKKDDDAAGEGESLDGVSGAVESSSKDVSSNDVEPIVAKKETAEDTTFSVKTNEKDVKISEPRLALAMKFALPSSCYATMAVREILRMDVSAGFQAMLNSSES